MSTPRKPLFKHRNHKRTYSSNDGLDPVLFLHSPIMNEMKQEQEGVQKVGNTCFVSRTQVAHRTHDEQGISELSLACSRGDLPLVKEYVEKGCLVNKQDSQGLTALYYAVKSNVLEVVTFLLQSGANPNIVSSRGHTILMYTVEYGTEDCMRCLCEYVKRANYPEVTCGRNLLNIQNNDGLTALMLACNTNLSSFVHILLEFGADASVRTFDGESALSLALVNNSCECVAELTRDEFFDCRSRQIHDGALYYASSCHYNDIVKLLVQKPAYLNQFISDIMNKPSRREETLVEIALRQCLSTLDSAARAELLSLCVKYAKFCLRCLFDFASGKAISIHVSPTGLADAAKWCIKQSKLLSVQPDIQDFDQYWTAIEKMTETMNAKYLEEVALLPTSPITPNRTEAESHDEGSDGSHIEKVGSDDSFSSSDTLQNSKGSELGLKHLMKPTTCSKLLLSFIEIYIIGHSNFSIAVSGDQKEELDNRLQSLHSIHPRVLSYFNKYKDFLICLVTSDPNVYSVLHFFKHSFNLFLNN